MIPLAEPNLTGKEQEYVADAIASGWVSGGGQYVERFERMVAKSCGRKWAVATVTGTAALHAALRASGVRKGDFVRMPSMTFMGAANAVLYLGAEPEFLDIDTGWRPTVSWVGQVADAAPAIGLRWPEGSKMLCFSFNGNKTITTGQGGAIVGNDPEDYERVLHLVSVAKTKGYECDEIGFNYRMSNVNAAIGCAQMEKLDEFWVAKKRIISRYKEAGLSMLDGNWMALWCASERDKIIRYLRDAKIDARPFWKPLHLQQPYKIFEREPLPNTEALWDKLICLPCSTNLTEADQDTVIKVCAEFL